MGKCFKNFPSIKLQDKCFEVMFPSLLSIATYREALAIDLSQIVSTEVSWKGI